MEACNGADDDCDGRADESLGGVGSAVTAAPGTLRSPRLVGLLTGYGVLYSGDSIGSPLFWRTLSTSGESPSPTFPVGADVVPTIFFGFSARFDGTNVIVAYASAANFHVVAFRPEDASRAWGPFTLPRPTGRTAGLVSRITHAGPGRVTVYAEFSEGSTYSLRRYRLETTSPVPSILLQHDVSAGLDGSLAWDAVTTGSSDVVVYRSTADDVVMTYGPNADGLLAFTPPTTLRTAAQEPGVVAIGVAVRSATVPVSASAPLAIAWQAAGGTGFLEVANIASPSGSRALLSGSVGRAACGFGCPDVIEIIAPPTTSTYMLNGHWVVLALDRDAPVSTGQVLRAWEISAEAGPRALDIPAEMAENRTEISAAASGSTMRVAQEGPTGEIVTRQLGCR